MKKLLYILFAVTLFVSCSDDDNGNETTQDYTSFVVENKSSSIDLSNVVVGYKSNNNYIILTVLGTINTNANSLIPKYNEEEKNYAYHRFINFNKFYKWTKGCKGKDYA